MKGVVFDLNTILPATYLFCFHGSDKVFIFLRLHTFRYVLSDTEGFDVRAIALNVISKGEASLLTHNKVKRCSFVSLLIPPHFLFQFAYSFIYFLLTY